MKAPQIITGCIGFTIGILVGFFVVGPLTNTVDGQPTCHPAHADSTAVWYVPAGENTAVKLIARCGGIETAWYVSFFEGEQPDLWTYAEIQNTASELLMGW